MPGVAEDHEVRQPVEWFLRNDGCVGGESRQALNGLRVLRYLTMTDHAFRGRREAGPLTGGRFRVAVHAFDLEAGVPLMAERQGLARPTKRRQGSE